MPHGRRLLDSVGGTRQQRDASFTDVLAAELVLVTDLVAVVQSGRAVLASVAVLGFA